MREYATLAIRNIVLSVITGLAFSLWQKSAPGGLWMGMVTLSISQWALDITSAITGHRERQSASTTTEGNDTAIECSK